jgi:hypothetical protein
MPAFQWKSVTRSDGIITPTIDSPLSSDHPSAMNHDKRPFVVCAQGARGGHPFGLLSLSTLLALAWTGPRAQADWPEFRGPRGDGHVSAAGDTQLIGLPLHWSETNNVRWKTAIPHRGWSTPVVLGGQVWVTTATLDGHDFFAVGVDAETGKILFNEPVFHSDAP